MIPASFEFHHVDPVDEAVIELVRATANAVVVALDKWTKWGPSGLKEGQYASDLAADQVAHEVLDAAGVGVLSEESGLIRGDADVVVIVDPLDGSTNASRHISWWATSICALDQHGLAASVVVDLVHGTRYEAVRGSGATRDGTPIAPSECTELGEAIVGISGLPPQSLGWSQFRSLGAAALDLCAVADGRLDGFVDCSVDAHGIWDYAGALLICQESGATMVDALGRDLVHREHAARRTPVCGASAELCQALVARRAAAFVEA